MRFLAIVNPAAGGGRRQQVAELLLDRLRSAGWEIETHTTRGHGEATEVVRRAYREGRRGFIAVGGDGTAFEIVNGLFPEAAKAGEKPVLGFLPAGTGNSFLRDFGSGTVEYAMDALLVNRRHSADVMRLTHAGGVLYYINLLSMGFAADVATVTNRRFKALGHLGYLAGVFTELARLRRRPLPVRLEGEADFDRRPCLFLSFNNSKYTGGAMLISPHADTGDGLIEYVRWGPIGRLGLLRNLHRLYDGSHLKHPLAERRAVRQVEFDLPGAVDVMVDGEVLTLECRKLEVLPAALEVIA